MKQFLLPPGYKEEREFELTGNDFHYLTRVLRKKEGSSFAGIDTTSNRYGIVIKKILSEKCIVEISKTSDKIRKAPLITLIQCLPKGKKMDLIVRQATETGVSRIIPLLSEFTVPKLSDQDLFRKKGRWERIAEEAVQQSGNERIPLIVPPIQMNKISQFVENFEYAFFFHQKPLENNTLHRYLFGEIGEVFLLIGPEGGLSDKEISFLQNTGFHPVYLGANVLRTETAALYAIASVQNILMEKDS